MRIGIDMRMAGTGEGIARYTEELVRHLAEIDFVNDYFLVCHIRASSTLRQAQGKVQNSKFRIVETNIDYYSWAEQTKFIWELVRLKLDVMHFPSFNAPIFYPGKFVVTIHDMIHHFFPGKKKARLVHRAAYRAVMRSAIAGSRKIIAVSESTKRDILENYQVPEEKIAVIYEGVGEGFFAADIADKLVLDRDRGSASYRTKFHITKPYLLFVGVWRQYKNLPRLAAAFDILHERHGRDLQLVLAGKIDPFYSEVYEGVMKASHRVDILAPGRVTDEELRALYHGASLFVLPSLVEGFGLIGVEAQAMGVPVAVSDIPVLREVLGDGALYFDPQSEEDMAAKMNMVLSDKHLQHKLTTAGKLNVKRFDWRKCAEATLKIYGKL